ncbi:MAG: hypothetical protein WCZ09_00880 [Bacilli bacterium]
MINLTNDELERIVGGLNITGTLINAFTGGIKIILDISRSLGTAMRRIYTNNLCKL